MHAWQQSLKEAHKVAKMVLGRAAAVAMAEHNNGVYRGVIIGHTRDYIVQQIGRHSAAVIHSKDWFAEREAEFPWPEVGQTVSIQYSHAQAVARQIRERSHQQELSR